MERSTEFPVLLFSYGTLQDKAVQLANFGRELVGQQDAMLGYSTSWVEITDPEVLRPVARPIIRLFRRAGGMRTVLKGWCFRLPSRNWRRRMRMKCRTISGFRWGWLRG